MEGEDLQETLIIQIQRSPVLETVCLGEEENLEMIGVVVGLIEIGQKIGISLGKIREVQTGLGERIQKEVLPVGIGGIEVLVDPEMKVKGKTEAIQEAVAKVKITKVMVVEIGTRVKEMIQVVAVGIGILVREMIQEGKKGMIKVERETRIQIEVQV